MEFFKWLQYNGEDNPPIVHMYKRTDAGVLHINIDKQVINILPEPLLDGRFIPKGTIPITEQEFMENFNSLRAMVNKILK